MPHDTARSSPQDEGSPQPIFWADTSVAAIVAPASQGPVGEPVRLHGLAELTATYGPPQDSPLGQAVQDFFVNGGRGAIAIRADEASGVPGALEVAEPFQLLTVHPSLVGEAGLAHEHELCTRRKAFLVADSVDGRLPAGLGSNAAAYLPRICGPDGQARPCAPAVAGIMARMAADRGVWRSPSGSSAQVVGARGVERELTPRELDKLHLRNVNGLRVMPDGSVVVWGARTASADPEWKYVCVRRLFLFLEESIDQGLQWVVFEPNDEPLWAQVRHDVEQFLTRLWREGAFPGERPSEAFQVRCDRTTMTQADLDAGRLVCEIGVAPVAPTEFVTFRIARTTAGAAEPGPPG